MKSGPRFLLALWVGKLLAAAIGVIAPSRGTFRPGKIACRFMPSMLSGFRGIDLAKTILVTGTNGKSTTNNLLVHIFRTAGLSVASNLEGANQHHGIVTALLRNATWTGHLRQDYLILEVDERNLPLIRAGLKAKNLVVTNIQSDQVQRNGDPDYIYRMILNSIDDTMTLFVNNEEPRSASLGRAAGRANAFSVAPNQHRSATGLDDFAVTMSCPVCHDALDFAGYNLGGVGPFRCPACGFASTQKPACRIDRVDYEARHFGVGDAEFHMAYDTAYYLYNCAAGVAVAREFGISDESLAKAFETFTNIDGRLVEFVSGGKRVRYMRIKQENPDTVQSAIDAMAADPSPKVLAVGLQTVSDFVPYYSNTAYFYDCYLPPAVLDGFEACVCFGTTCCYDTATRLVYAGLDPAKIAIVDSDKPRDVLTALQQFSSDRVYLITKLDEFEVWKRQAIEPSPAVILPKAGPPSHSVILPKAGPQVVTP